MHISSVANYALDVHLNRKSIKQTTPNTVSPIPVKPVVLICRRLFAIGRKQRQDLYLFILFHILHKHRTVDGSLCVLCFEPCPFDLSLQMISFELTCYFSLLVLFAYICSHNLAPFFIIIQILHVHI